MIRTVLVDDEIDSIRVLQRLLETACPDVEIVGKADGVETALHTIQTRMQRKNAISARNTVFSRRRQEVRLTRRSLPPTRHEAVIVQNT